MADGIPIHRQISRILEGRMTNGLYAPGTLIPSESRLCQEFGVSRITVRQSLSELVTRGLLVKHQGLGTAVSPHFQPFGPPASTGYLEDVLLFFASTRVVGSRREMVSAPAHVAEQLALAAGTPVCVIVRWRTLDDRPFCVSSTFVDTERAALITDEDLSRSTFIELLEENLGARLSGAHQVLWATVADTAIAEQLDLAAGAPVLALSLTYYSTDGEPVAYTRTNFRGDRYTHHVRLGRVPVNGAVARGQH
jgi:GntR family transcriptional regulator